MQAIQGFFEGIGNSLIIAFEFLTSCFRDLIDTVKLLTQLPSVLERMFSWFPPELMTMFIVLLTCIIIYKILGREG